MDRRASYPRNERWRRRTQLSHRALTASHLRGLLRWLQDYWSDERARILEELAPGQALFSDWLCALAQAWHDAFMSGARLPDEVARKTGLRSLRDLLASSVVDNVDDLEAHLWVAWLWVRGADESTRHATLGAEADRMGYKSTLALRNLLNDAAGARSTLLSEFPQIRSAAAVAAAGAPREEAPNAPLLMVEPAPPHGIFGREQKLAQLRKMVIEGDSGSGATPPVVLLGMGGIGKTTLAVALARDPSIQRHFSDGVAWTALGPRPNVRALQLRLGRALNVDLSLEVDLRACTGALRSALEQRRMLFVVDDVWDSLPAAGFDVAGARSAMVFTTRELQVANAVATPARAVRVDLLDEDAAVALLRKLLPAHVDVSERDAKRLVGKLERLPLALVLAGRFLATQAYVPGYFARMMGELLERREARLRLLAVNGRLGLPETEPVRLRDILGMSVERLDRTDRERFAMTSVLGGDPLTWDIDAAAAAWGCSVEAAEETTSHLIQRGLVQPRGERYWMHALLSDHAAELLAERTDHQ